MPDEGGGWRKLGRKPVCCNEVRIIGVGERPGFVGIGAVGGRFGVRVAGLGGWARFVARRSGPIQCLCALGGEVDGSVAHVSVSRERVDHEREAEEVDVLACLADAVGAAEPECVVEVPID